MNRPLVEQLAEATARARWDARRGRPIRRLEEILRSLADQDFAAHAAKDDEEPPITAAPRPSNIPSRKEVPKG